MDFEAVDGKGEGGVGGQGHGFVLQGDGVDSRLNVKFVYLAVQTIRKKHRLRIPSSHTINNPNLRRISNFLYFDRSAVQVNELDRTTARCWANAREVVDDCPDGKDIRSDLAYPREGVRWLRGRQAEETCSGGSGWVDGPDFRDVETGGEKGAIGTDGDVLELGWLVLVGELEEGFGDCHVDDWFKVEVVKLEGLETEL